MWRCRRSGWAEYSSPDGKRHPHQRVCWQLRGLLRGVTAAARLATISLLAAPLGAEAPASPDPTASPAPITHPDEQLALDWLAQRAAADGLVDGGDMDIISVGLNWWLTQVAQFSLNYRYITLDQSGIEGRSTGITSRIVLILD